jgi:hypothetical protein
VRMWATTGLAGMLDSCHATAGTGTAARLAAYTPTTMNPHPTPSTLPHTHHVDFGVARHPLPVAHPQRLARGGAVEEVVSVAEVVAQPARALLGDVVHVDGRVGGQDGLELGGLRAVRVHVGGGWVGGGWGGAPAWPPRCVLSGDAARPQHPPTGARQRLAGLKTSQPGHPPCSTAGPARTRRTSRTCRTRSWRSCTRGTGRT